MGIDVFIMVHKFLVVLLWLSLLASVCFAQTCPSGGSSTTPVTKCIQTSQYNNTYWADYWKNSVSVRAVCKYTFEVINNYPCAVPLYWYLAGESVYSVGTHDDIWVLGSDQTSLPSYVTFGSAYSLNSSVSVVASGYDVGTVNGSSVTCTAAQQVGPTTSANTTDPAKRSSVAQGMFKQTGSSTWYLFTPSITTPTVAAITVNLVTDGLSFVSPTTYTIPSGTLVAPTINVTVTPQMDATWRGTYYNSTVSHICASSSTVFMLKNITTTDTRVPGVSINQTQVMTVDYTGEGGAFSVVLNTPPTSNVLVHLLVGNNLIANSVPQTYNLTFNASNWNTPQVVLVKADVTYVDYGGSYYNYINVTNIESSDTNYDGITSTITTTPLYVQTCEGGAIELSCAPGTKILVTKGFYGRDSYSLCPYCGVGSTGPSCAAMNNRNCSAPLANSTLANACNNKTSCSVAFTNTGLGGDPCNGIYKYGYATWTCVPPPTNAIVVNVLTNPAIHAGITVAPVSLTVVDGGSGSSYTVKLSSQPTAPVTISMIVPSRLTVSPSTLVFNDSNWNTTQTIYVEAVVTGILNGAAITVKVNHSSVSADDNYNSVGGYTLINNVTVRIVASSSAAVLLNPNDTTITMGGPAGSFTIRLNTKPSSTDVVTITAVANAQLTLNATSFSFSSTNYNVPQWVGVAAVNTFSATPPSSLTLLSFSLAVTGPSAGSDPFRSVVVPSERVTILNANVAGVTITASNVFPLSVTQGGAADSFTVTLSSRPSSNVIVTFPNPASSRLGFSVGSVTFTSSNWSTVATVTVTAASATITTPTTYTVSPSVTSADSLYSGISVSTVDIVLFTPAILLTPTAADLVSGSWMTYSLVLTSPPSSPSTLTISNLSPNISLTSPSFLFTSANWSNVQTVNVTAPFRIFCLPNVTALVNHSVTAGDVVYRNLRGGLLNLTVSTACPLTCGNGIVAGWKLSVGRCEDGNTLNGDGCDSSCNVEAGYACTGGDGSGLHAQNCSAVCGDGHVVGAEAVGNGCDDGNTVSGDGCSSTCQVESAYSCSPGDFSTPSSCDGRCGDGISVGTEQLSGHCDDNNTVSGDGCSSSCLVEVGWTCSTGSMTNRSYCSVVCGDGHVVGAEAVGNGCDDGNTVSGDGCSSTCQVESGYDCYFGSLFQADFCSPICGDGRKVGLEQCDDGNVLNGDGCSYQCLVEGGWSCVGGNSSVPDSCAAICGDGWRLGSEACDDGNLLNGDGCNGSCAVETGWSCSGGSPIAADSCIVPCGDCVIFGNETCDDCNGANGDGCSSVCLVEAGWTCTGSASSVCSVLPPICGNTVISGSETCDDGNLIDGDGCSSSCQIESGWNCTGTSSSVCTMMCGDGIQLPLEDCDDNNTVSGDGCSSTCALETGFTCVVTPLLPTVCNAICGDGVQMPSEGCDDGNTVNDDGCSANCTVEIDYSCTGGSPSTPSVCHCVWAAPTACPLISGNVCNEKGNCHPYTKQCLCVQPYYGCACQFQRCVPGCVNGGACNASTGECVCSYPFYGSKCQYKSCAEDCSGRGQCDSMSGLCRCPEPYFGPTCEYKSCPNDCHGNGRCNVSTGRCDCYSGFTGEDCELIRCPVDCGLYGGVCDMYHGTCECSKEGALPHDCRLIACPNNCSGNGDCAYGVGLCFCDQHHYGLDCSLER